MDLVKNESIKVEVNPMPLLTYDPDEIATVEHQHGTVDELDKYNEVWDGATVVMSQPDIEHQVIVSKVSGIVHSTYNWKIPPYVLAGVNVSDRVEGWKENYRCSDVAVFLEGTSAVNCGTHWCGGPDFLTEVASPRDLTWEKLPFYASIKLAKPSSSIAIPGS